MDFYLNDEHVINRLVREWKQHGKLIIAYDFDNTVYDFHQEGHTYDQVIQLLRRCQKVGAYFIVFTANPPHKYEELQAYLDEKGIPFDKINEDMDFINFNARKIYYNILLDDRAGLSSAHQTLLQAVTIMEEEGI